MPRKSKKVEESSEGSSEHDAAEPKTKKSKKQAEEPAVYVDPPDKVKNAKGKPATLKITSWNVDGLRAWVKKNALEWVTKDSPDILCLQEVKCSAENVPAAVRDLEDFPHQFWSTGVREGLHGVGLLCKEKPLKVTYGINMKEFDEEGRAITAEFDSFILVMAYVPNSGRGLVRLDDRERWDETFCKHLKALQEDKPLVVCGDFNVAYEEIDLKNPKSNKDRTPGFTQRERDGFGRLLDIGLVDSFRKLYPDVQYAYTFWTYMMNARAKNVGWRLDYFLLSNDLMSALCDSKIRSDVRGSDHCPISLRLAM